MDGTGGLTEARQINLARALSGLDCGDPLLWILDTRV
jgi:hypothetical protein